MWSLGKTQSNSIISRFVVFIPAILGLAYVVLNFSLLLEDQIHNMDRTLIELSVEQARTFDIFSGAFSRFGFRHPGPFYYYYLSFGSYFFSWLDNPTAIYRFLTLIFNISALTIAVVLLEKYFRRGHSPLLLVGILAATWNAKRFYILDYWNPNLIPALAILFILGSTLLLIGELGFISLVLISASMIIQLHVSGLPFVGLTMVALLGILLIKHLFIEEHKFHQLRFYKLALTVLVLLILWTPVIFDSVFFDGGNPARILNFISSTKSTYNFDTGFQLVVSFFRGPLTFFGSIPDTLAFCILTLAPLFFWKLFSTATRNLCVVYIISVAITVFSATKIDGALHHYLISSYYGVLTIGLYLTLSGIFSLLESFKNVASPTLILGASLLFFIILWPKPLNINSRTDRVKDEAARYIAAMNPNHETLYEVSFGSPAPYKFAAGIILELTRQGIHTCVQPQWGYFFGDGLRCDYRKSFKPKDYLGTLKFEFNLPTKIPLHTKNRYQERSHSIQWSTPDV